MKKSVFISFLMLIYFSSFSQKNNVADLLIPEPVSVVSDNGNFVLNNKTNIQVLSTDGSARRIAQFLSKKIEKATGYSVPVATNSKNQNVTGIKLSLTHDASLGNEGYKLKVASNGISLSANKPAGLFYGLQTLVQLLPKEIEGNQVAKNIKWDIPACSITDYPRFGWRGLMFDVSRHFFTKDEVEEFIDQMVRYKYNLLHLHLTDDEGWRIEIKGLPNLTKVGAWNVKKVGYFGTFSPPTPNEPRTYGGFYSQDDIKELVKYAQDRFVNILPEIDVPGHSLAAVVSYPELSCTPGAENYHVHSGEVMGRIDNTLCPANEKVYEFLDKVMTQVAELFPFQYIHCGGDECNTYFWKKSDSVNALMQREGLTNMDQVQSYFEKRLEKIVESKGKKFMGWEEILQGGGGVAHSAAVMGWRGMKGGIEAAKMKYDVVMSPTDFAYLVFMQGDPIIEPHIYATLRLNKAYQFEPVPDGVNPKYIKGGQGNLWTEQVYNMRHMEYMLWPRAMAIAEVLWSPKDKRSWDNFSGRVEKQFKRLDEAQIKYAPSIYDPIFNVSKTDSNQLKIELSTEIKGLDIYYSFDNSFPDNFYPKYTGPLIPPKDAVMLKVITYRGKKPIGRMISIPIEELQKRTSGNFSTFP
jgi:hexosaminidase